MNWIDTFSEFELLTPAWAGGADPFQGAELRIPTIRGQLRFWLRMLNPDSALDARLMGEAGSGESRASALSMRLVSEQGTASATKDLTSYTGARTDNDALRHAEAYFLWPLRRQHRGVIMGPASFTLAHSWLPSGGISAGERRKFDEALRAFSLLGSFGTRSTRGYGSVWPKGLIPASPRELTSALEFLPDDISVRLLEGTYTKSRDALGAAAQWLRRLRFGSHRLAQQEGLKPSSWGINDHDAAAPSGTGKPTVFRQALGMPLNQRFDRQPRVVTVQSTFAGNDRYPSPVRLKIARISGDYRVLLIVLRSQLLASGTTIKLRGTGVERSSQLSLDLVNHIATLGTGLH